MRLPELDGLRGLAVLLVVAGHVSESVVPYGGVVGVTVFFVLSGFVITRALLDEAERDGRIRLGRFWVRRLARLTPAFALMLAGTALLVVAVQDPTASEMPVRLAIAGTYLADYARALGADLGVLDHTWSLAVEEHFYAVWPFVLIALLATARRRPRLAAGLLVGLVAAALTWRVVATATMPYDWLAYAFDTSAAGLLVGCGSAVAVRVGALGSGVRRWAVLAGWVGVVGLVGLSVCTLPFGPGPLDGVTRWVETVTIVVSALVVVCAARGTVPPLRLRPLVWFGTISYGFYLWHYPLLVLRPGGVVTEGAPRLVAVGIALALAVLSWYLVERPIVRAARRWSAGVPRGPAAHPVTAELVR